MLAVAAVLATISTWHDVSHVDPKEISCLAQALYYEGRSAPLTDQIMLASTMINRANTEKKSLCVSVKNPRSYYWVTDVKTGKQPATIKDQAAYRRAVEIAALTYTRIVDDPTAGATHFLMKDEHPAWSRRVTTTAHGIKFRFLKDDWCGKPKLRPCPQEPVKFASASHPGIVPDVPVDVGRQKDTDMLVPEPIASIITSIEYAWSFSVDDTVGGRVIYLLGWLVQAIFILGCISFLRIVYNSIDRLISFLPRRKKMTLGQATEEFLKSDPIGIPAGTTKQKVSVVPDTTSIGLSVDGVDHIFSEQVLLHHLHNSHFLAADSTVHYPEMWISLDGNGQYKVSDDLPAIPIQSVMKDNALTGFYWLCKGLSSSTKPYSFSYTQVRRIYDFLRSLHPEEPSEEICHLREKIFAPAMYTQSTVTMYHG